MGVLLGVVLLVNLTTVVALGYGDPDEFVLRENANGGVYRVGHALSWETRSRIVALWLAGFAFAEIARRMQCAYNTVKNIVQEFVTSVVWRPARIPGRGTSFPRWESESFCI